MSDEISKDYREGLAEGNRRMQGEYDKTVLTLSGGALGVSFAFVDKFITHRPILHDGLLVGAWTCWAASLFIVLVSYYMSGMSYRKAIKQTDAHVIRHQRPGGISTLIVSVCNAGSGLCFLGGVVLIILFVRYNMGG